MTEMQIRTVKESGKAPDYTKTAAALLKRCREFYQDPENVKAFEEWKAARSGKHETVKGEKGLHGRRNNRDQKSGNGNGY